MKNISKKQQQKALSDDGWTVTEWGMGLKDVPVDKNIVRDTYEACQLNGLNTKKHGFYFVENDNQITYRAGNCYYRLGK
jgi:hypothetical protein